MKDVAATGVLHGGKLRLDDKLGFAADIAGMKDGSIVLTVVHGTEKAIRSTRANRYYYGVVLKAIKGETGQDLDDIHDFMCQRFLTRRMFLVNNRSGEVEEGEVAGRSSKLSPDDFFEFVEKVRLFATEFFGIRIEDPNPAWRDRESAA
jgi:hypothetical protein